MLDHPYVPPLNEILQASLLTGVPTSKLTDAVANHTSYVNSNSLSLLVQSQNIKNSYDCMSIKHYYDTAKKTVFIRSNNGSFSNAFSISLAYLLAKYEGARLTYAIKELLKRHKIMSERIEDFESLYRQLSSIHNKMNEYHIHINDEIDPDKLNKILKGFKRKYKIKGDITEEGLIKLSFKNLKVGNELEGYIIYKTLEFYIDVDNMYRIKKIRFTFKSGLVYDTDWRLQTDLYFHPHISFTNICYGNQQNFVNAYIASDDIEMFVDVLYSVVTGYNPGSHNENDDEMNGNQVPYQSVTQISQSLSQLEELWDNITDIENIDQRSKQVLSMQRIYPEGAMSFSPDECPNCGVELSHNDDDDFYYCDNEYCISSGAHLERCPECNSVMTRVWNSENRYYRHFCRNRDCIEGPVRLHHGTSPRCPECDRLIEQYDTESNAFRCNNCGCSITFDFDGNPDITNFVLPEGRVLRRVVGDLAIFNRNRTEEEQPF